MPSCFSSSATGQHNVPSTFSVSSKLQQNGSFPSVCLPSPAQKQPSFKLFISYITERTLMTSKPRHAGYLYTHTPKKNTPAGLRIPRSSSYGMRKWNGKSPKPVQRKLIQKERSGPRQQYQQILPDRSERDANQRAGTACDPTGRQGEREWSSTRSLSTGNPAAALSYQAISAPPHPLVTQPTPADTSSVATLCLGRKGGNRGSSFSLGTLHFFSYL